MAWSQTDANSHGIENQGLGIMFQGTEATLVADYGHYRIIPEKKGTKIDEPPKTLPRSVGHHREWLDAIKTRSQCSCHFGYGHRLTSVGHLGNISLWTGEKLHVGPGRRADHQPRRGQPVPDQGIPQALDAPRRLTPAARDHPTGVPP